MTTTDIQSPAHSPESALGLERVPSLHRGKSEPRVVAEVFSADLSTNPPTSAHLTPILFRFAAVKTLLTVDHAGIWVLRLETLTASNRVTADVASAS